MAKFYTEKEWDRMTKEYDKTSYACSCGHKVQIPNWKDKILCSWCKKYVFKSKKDEILFRIKEKINEKNN